MPLVLGAGGMLGRAVAEVLEGACPDTVSATRAEIDVTDRGRLEAEVERLRPTVVVNCAAWTDEAACEADPERAFLVNAEGAGNVARVAAAAGSRMVHLSGDWVFDGAGRRPWAESDTPGPTSVYGRSKLEGERLVAAAAPEHLILRTAWLYGPGRVNFVDAIRDEARAGVIVRVAPGPPGSPTWVLDVAEAILALLDTTHHGLVHFVNTGVCTRLDLAKAIQETLDGRARPEQVRDGHEAGVEGRPAPATLDTTLYARLTGCAPRGWRAALDDYLGVRPHREDA